jgi:hypothetical protein
VYVIVVGAGKVGWNLARELIDKGNELTVIESDARRFATVEEELEHAAQYGDGSELWVLERGGIERADLVIAVTGDDEDNILICQVAREKYGVERVIARCNNPRNLQHFELLGVKPAVSATDLILRLIEHEVPTCRRSGSRSSSWRCGPGRARRAARCASSASPRGRSLSRSCATAPASSHSRIRSSRRATRCFWSSTPASRTRSPPSSSRPASTAPPELRHGGS